MTQPWKRDRESSHLHPVFRVKVENLLKDCDAEDLPFKLFEGLRSPQRQQYLYAQGRTRPGNIVTKARPWSSNHQYGVAADFVLYENGSWSWDTSGDKRRWWERLHELGRDQGLEPLSWEKPHLQMVGLKTDDLRAGHYPPDGDDAWAESLEAYIYSWPNTSESPPVPDLLPDRPAIDVEPTRLAEDLAIVPEVTVDWHRSFDGCEWRYDGDGIYLRDHSGGRQPLRTRGKPLTCRTIWSLFHEEIATASRKYDIPQALLMMVIATETGFARNYGFTGPHTFRWESHVQVNDVSPPTWGDYSAGPMQILATTARWIILKHDLDYDPFVIAPVYEHRPEPPASLPLYDPAISIDIGAAGIKQRSNKTKNDPILVAAAYNAGGLYKSPHNPWHLRTTGDHLTRASKWYGDACAVLNEMKA